MIDLYYWTTPNGHKVTTFLEEAGLPYRIVPINISTGEQFKPAFLNSFVLMRCVLLRRTQSSTPTAVKISGGFMGNISAAFGYVFATTNAYRGIIRPSIRTIALFSFTFHFGSVAYAS